MNPWAVSIIIVISYVVLASLYVVFVKKDEPQIPEYFFWDPRSGPGGACIMACVWFCVTWLIINLA